MEIYIYCFPKLYSMHKITLKFLLTNILTAVFLILNTQDWVIKYDEVMHQENVGLGIGLLIFFVLGFLVRVKMAYSSAYNAQKNISKFERFFIGVLLLFALTSTMNFSFISTNNIFGDIEANEGFKTYLSMTLIIISVLLLIAEAMILFVEDKAELKPPKHEKAYNRLYQYYVSIGIALSWNIMMIGNSQGLSFDMPDFWPELFANIALVVMLVLPFQRFFWYEIFSASKTLKDQFIVFSSLLIVIASAVVPLFFV